MMMRAEGGEPETLWQGAVQSAAWRPDNRHVLFVTRAETSADLVELDVTTRKTRTIYDAPSITRPSISLDGRIAYADFRHDQFLFAVDVDGQRLYLVALPCNERQESSYEVGDQVVVVEVNKGSALVTRMDALD